MDTTAEHLLKMLISLRTERPFNLYGICSNIGYLVAKLGEFEGLAVESLLSELLEQIHPGNCTPIEGIKYHNAEALHNRWNPDHPWGAARFALLETLIDKCQELVNKQKDPA